MHSNEVHTCISTYIHMHTYNVPTHTPTLTTHTLTCSLEMYVTSLLCRGMYWFPMSACILRPSLRSFSSLLSSFFPCTCPAKVPPFCHHPRELKMHSDTRAHIHIHTHTCTHLHTYMHTNMHTNMHTYIHTHTCTHTCTLAYTLAHIHAHTHTHTHMHKHMYTVHVFTHDRYKHTNQKTKINVPN